MPGKWMAQAFKNAHGQLHESLKVPQDKNIPVSKLERAAHGSGLLQKRAQLVLNARKSNE